MPCVTGDSRIFKYAFDFLNNKEEEKSATKIKPTKK